MFTLILVLELGAHTGKKRWINRETGKTHNSTICGLLRRPHNTVTVIDARTITERYN